MQKIQEYFFIFVTQKRHLRPLWYGNEKFFSS